MSDEIIDQDCSNETTKVLAAVARLADGRPYQWYLCSDRDRVFNTPDEEVIWVETLEDLLAELESRNPRPEEDLTYLRIQSDTSVFVRERPTYISSIDIKDEAQFERPLELAKKYGSIGLVICCEHVDGTFLDVQTVGSAVESAINKGGSILKLRELNFHSRIRYAELVYDPAAAKKHRRKLETKRLVSVKDVFRLLRVFSRSLFNVGSPPGFKVFGLTADSACAELKIVLSYYELAFGKKSYLNQLEFLDIVKRWDNRSYKRFVSLGDNCREFAEWMNKQSKRRASKGSTQPVTNTKLNLTYPK